MSWHGLRPARPVMPSMMTGVSEGNSGSIVMRGDPRRSRSARAHQLQCFIQIRFHGNPAVAPILCARRLGRSPQGASRQDFQLRCLIERFDEANAKLTKMRNAGEYIDQHTLYVAPLRDPVSTGPSACIATHTPWFARRESCTGRIPAAANSSISIIDNRPVVSNSELALRIDHERIEPMLPFDICFDIG